MSLRTIDVGDFMEKTPKDTALSWDPYAVWGILMRRNPVSIEEPGASTGKMDTALTREFMMMIAEYPDHLQDALLVIAHAKGFPAAIHALDAAIREHVGDDADVSLTLNVNVRPRAAEAADGAVSVDVPMHDGPAPGHRVDGRRGSKKARRDSTPRGSSLSAVGGR